MTATPGILCMDPETFARERRTLLRLGVRRRRNPVAELKRLVEVLKETNAVVLELPGGVQAPTRRPAA